MVSVPPPCKKKSIDIPGSQISSWEGGKKGTDRQNSVDFNIDKLLIPPTGK